MTEVAVFAPASRGPLVGLAIAVVAVVLYDTVRMIGALRASEASTAASTPFSARPSPAGARVLVLGDSTAVGTGADRAELSVAGRIAGAFPAVLVDNVARDGARVRDLQAQLAAVDERYDVALVQIGGNDILRFTPLAQLEEHFDAFLADLRHTAFHVAIIAPGLVGRAPAIPWPLSTAYNLRSRQVRDRLATLALLRDVAFVDLDSGAADGDPFADDPQHFYAGDGLHPSGAGYGLWYDTLARQVPLRAWLLGDGGESAPAHHR